MWDRASRWWRDRYRKAGSAVLANGRSRRPRNSKYMRVCDIVTYTLRRCKQFLRRGRFTMRDSTDFQIDSADDQSTESALEIGEPRPFGKGRGEISQMCTLALRGQSGVDRTPAEC